MGPRSAHRVGAMTYRTRKPTSLKLYIVGVILSIDILLNAILAGRVRTISERIGEIKSKGKLGQFPVERLIDTYILEKLDPGHSLRVYENNRRPTCAGTTCGTKIRQL